MAGSLWPAPFPPPPSTADCSGVIRGRSEGTSAGLSDFPRPFVIGVCPWTSRYDFRGHPRRVNMGSPGSRARCFRTCTGSVTARGRAHLAMATTPGIAFRFLLRRRHPGVIVTFAAQYPACACPCQRFDAAPSRRLRMTRGRCGSLNHFRMTLSSTTPRQFIPAHEGLLG